MASRRLIHAVGTAVLLLFAFVVTSIVSSRAQEPQGNYGVGIPELSKILAIQGNPRREQDTRLQTARDDTEDAIAVLTQGNLFPAAVTPLTEAQNLIASAQATSNPDERRLLVQQAIAKLDEARGSVVT